MKPATTDKKNIGNKIKPKFMTLYIYHTFSKYIWNIGVGCFKKIAFIDVIRFIIQEWNQDFKVIVFYLKPVIGVKLPDKKYPG